MPLPTRQLHNPTLLHQLPHTALPPRHATKENRRPRLHIIRHNLAQNLRRSGIHARHAVDVEDDVLVVLFTPHRRKRGVRVVRSVVLEAFEAVLEGAGVGES